MRPKTIKTFGREETAREKEMKSVRIDAKTIIMVDHSITDTEARENFRLKQEENCRKFEKRKDAFRW